MHPLVEAKMEVQTIEKSTLKRLKSWILIAKPIWFLLSLGLLFFLIELTLWFLNIRKAVASGGAIMVGSAIISQIYYSRLPVKEAIFGSGQMNLKRQRIFPDRNVKQIDENQFKDHQLLYNLTRRIDYVTHPTDGSNILVLESVCYRVDKYIEIAITTSAAVGTVIWAYGNELFT